MMKTYSLLSGFVFIVSCSEPVGKRGPSLALVEDVVIIDPSSGNPDAPHAFILTEKEAADFLNNSNIVSGRELHDYYNSGGDDSYSGTGTISGMSVKWTITNGGTGTITRDFDAETFRIADPAKREKPDPRD